MSNRSIKKEKIEYSLKRVEEGTDYGHTTLLNDVASLLEDIKLFKFHDTLSESNVPKLDLVNRLEKIKNETIQGIFDNF